MMFVLTLSITNGYELLCLHACLQAKILHVKTNDLLVFNVTFLFNLGRF
jgi:hypothetical protein